MGLYVYGKYRERCVRANSRTGSYWQGLPTFFTTLVTVTKVPLRGILSGIDSVAVKLGTLEKAGGLLILAFALGSGMCIFCLGAWADAVLQET